MSLHACLVLRIKSIAFSAYPVSDMARSRAFYEESLGLSLSHNFRDTWVEYDLAGATFTITTMAEDLKPGARGGFVAFEVDDLDAWIELLQAKGVPILIEPFETPVCRMGVVADPDGNGITLHQAKPGHS